MKPTLFQRFCDHGWLTLNYLIGAIMLSVLVWNWGEWDMPQKLICMLAIAIPAHNFEEYTCPGGFFFMNNLSMFSKEPLRYPQITVNTMITNTGAELFLVVLTFLAPQIGLPVAAMVVIFGYAETLVHIVDSLVMKVRYRGLGKHTIYTPGLATCLFLLTPLSTLALSWMATQTVTGADIGIGIAFVAVVMVCFIGIPFGIAFKRHPEKYAMTPDLGYFEKYEKMLDDESREGIVQRCASLRP